MPLAIALSGCGGGGGGGNNGGGGGTPTPTTLNYTINWAERTRTAAPSSALSFTLSVKNPTGTVVLTDSHDRDGNLAAHNTTYTSTGTVTPGSYQATFTFYASAGGAGTAGNQVVGVASQTVDLPQSGAVPNITTQGTLSTLIVDPQSVQVGSTITPTYLAGNANGDVLVLSPGSAKWEVIEGGAFLQVVENGSALKGLAVGVATVRVTIDGKTATGTVEVRGAPQTVTMNVMNEPILWAAFQDGNGGWGPATMDGSTLSGTVGSSTGRYGFAYATDNGAGPEVHTYYATVFETKALTVGSAEVVTDGELSGTVSNLGADERISVNGYGSFDLIAGNGPYTVTMGQKATWDLIAVREDINLNVLGMIARRGLTSTPLSGVNLDATTFVAPTTFTLNLSGGDEPNNSTFVEMKTVNGTNAVLGFQPGNTLTYPTLAAAQRSANDRYTQWGSTFGTDTSQEVAKIRATPANDNLTLSAAPVAPTFSSSGVGEGTTGVVQFVFPSAGKAFETQFQGSNATYTTTMTKGWIGSATTFETPSFIGVGSFDPNWVLGDIFGNSARLYENNGSVADLNDPAAMRRDGYVWETFDWFPSTGSFRQLAGKKLRPGLLGAPVRSLPTKGK